MVEKTQHIGRVLEILDKSIDSLAFFASSVCDLTNRVREGDTLDASSQCVKRKVLPITESHSNFVVPGLARIARERPHDLEFAQI